MKINVYDFDKTIYDGDSSIDFYKFCLRKKKRIIIYLLPLSFYYILYFCKIVKKVKVKEIFFGFLNQFDNIDNMVYTFWKDNESKIKSFYIDKSHNRDIIISASPTFLLEPIAKKLKVKDLIASEVDKTNGKFISPNCKGEEKVVRLKNKYTNFSIDNMYTDSYSDMPLIKLSKKAYIVNKNSIKCIK